MFTFKLVGFLQLANCWGSRQSGRPRSAVHRGPSEGQAACSPASLCRQQGKAGAERDPKPSLSIILRETKYLIVRSRQTHSPRQISLTPWYPGAQSILIKKRFRLLHGFESRASFTDTGPQREAAGSTSDVQLSSWPSPPASPPETLPQALGGQLAEQRGGLLSVPLLATACLPRQVSPSQPWSSNSSLVQPPPPPTPTLNMWGAGSCFQHQVFLH